VPPRLSAAWAPSGYHAEIDSHTRSMREGPGQRSSIKLHEHDGLITKLVALEHASKTDSTFICEFNKSKSKYRVWVSAHPTIHHLKPKKKSMSLA
jgi:hypothetical protein